MDSSQFSEYVLQREGRGGKLPQVPPHIKEELEDRPIEDVKCSTVVVGDGSRLGQDLS